jgi:enoyl-CoA hydratase/carnithine racemase
MGLSDVFVATSEEVTPAAVRLAREIAECSPLGVVAWDGYADRVAAATTLELENQNALRGTVDFAEGVKAMTERRLPHFVGA